MNWGKVLCHPFAISHAVGPASDSQLSPRFLGPQRGPEHDPPLNIDRDRVLTRQIIRVADLVQGPRWGGPALNGFKLCRKASAGSSCSARASCAGRACARAFCCRTLVRGSCVVWISARAAFRCLCASCPGLARASCSADHAWNCLNKASGDSPLFSV